MGHILGYVGERDSLGSEDGCEGAARGVGAEELVFGSCLHGAVVEDGDGLGDTAESCDALDGAGLDGAVVVDAWYAL